MKWEEIYEVVFGAYIKLFIIWLVYEFSKYIAKDKDFNKLGTYLTCIGGVAVIALMSMTMEKKDNWNVVVEVFLILIIPSLIGIKTGEKK